MRSSQSSFLRRIGVALRIETRFQPWPAQWRGGWSKLMAETVVTSIRIERPSLAALRSVAIARANQEGGRVSIGRAVDDLVRRYCADLTKAAVA
jgi:hypothetical protein